MDGVLIIDKPAGMTSHDVVARVRKMTGVRRVGHTGTLDPFATGVLVVLVGRATRLAQFLSGAEKEYAAVIRLGYATDTGDVTGTRLGRTATNFTTETQRCTEIHRAEIEAALAALRGKIEQIPPMYSAKKVEGRKLYELARRGEEIKRPSVRVTVSEFEPITHEGVLLKLNDQETCDLAVRVVCSAGTYVRTLAEDFGRRIGFGAHLAALRRTRAGQFKIKDAVTLGRLIELTQSGAIEPLLISPDAALSHLPGVQLNPGEARGALHGVDMEVDETVASGWASGQTVRMRDESGALIAVGIYDHERNVIHPKVVIANQERSY